MQWRESRCGSGEMFLTEHIIKSNGSVLRTFAVASLCALSLSACNASSMLGSGTGALGTGETLHQGYVVDEQTLALVPVGSSREQVLLSLGTPSTTATFDHEVFFYISQTRKRPVAFMKPQLVDQSVLTIYFDKDGNVGRIANYTLKDGKPFDMVTRTTPTGGKEQTFLGQLLSGGAGKGITRSILEGI